MERLKISTSTELVRIPTDEIVCIVADGNYCDIRLLNGKDHKMTFKLHYFDEAFQQLKDNHFVRVGKSVIVNKDYIYLINLTEQHMILASKHARGEYTIRASREALKELKTMMEQEDDNQQKGETK